MPSTYVKQLQKIVNEYMADGRSIITTQEVAAWAVRNGLWKPQPFDLINQCAEHLSRAMREEYIIDPQGRVVRANHAARMEQTVFWADIRMASRKHMKIAFKQRRQQILGDCRQLKKDADSYNENNNSGKPIQIVFDFTLDLAEEEAA